METVVPFDDVAAIIRMVGVDAGVVHDTHSDTLVYPDALAGAVEEAMANIGAGKRKLLAGYADRRLAALAEVPRSYTVAGATVLCDATQGTVSDLLALEKWGAANPTATVPWIANDGSVTPLTGAQVVALGNAVGPHRLGLYNTCADVHVQIANGTITTTAQIDAAAWPA